MTQPTGPVNTAAALPTQGRAAIAALLPICHKPPAIAPPALPIPFNPSRVRKILPNHLTEEVIIPPNPFSNLEAIPPAKNGTNSVIILSIPFSVFGTTSFKSTLPKPIIDPPITLESVPATAPIAPSILNNQLPSSFFFLSFSLSSSTFFFSSSTSSLRFFILSLRDCQVVFAWVDSSVCSSTRGLVFLNSLDRKPLALEVFVSS